MEALNTLKLPSNYLEVSDDEVEFIDAKDWFNDFFKPTIKIVSGAADIVNGIANFVLNPNPLMKANGVYKAVSGAVKMGNGMASLVD